MQWELLNMFLLCVGSWATWLQLEKKCISSSCVCTDSGLKSADARANQECVNTAVNKIVPNNDDTYSDGDDDNKDDNEFYV